MAPYVVSRSRTYPAGVAKSFDLILPCSLPTVFDHRYGPIAPIRDVRDQEAVWGTPGQTRTIVLGDGTQLREELLTVVRPSEFTYRIAVVKGPLRALVADAKGRWAFESVGTGVRITWSWTITPRSAVAARLMPLMGHYWQGYARQGLEQIESLLLPA